MFPAFQVLETIGLTGKIYCKNLQSSISRQLFEMLYNKFLWNSYLWNNGYLINFLTVTKKTVDVKDAAVSDND